MSAFMDQFDNGNNTGDPYTGSDGGFHPERTEDEWSWSPAQRVEASVQESFGAIWGGLGAVADTLGMDSASDWAVNRSQELFEKAADHDIVNTDFSTIRNPLDFFKWGAETITSYAPDLVLMAAGGVGAGAFASRAAGTKLGHAATKGMLKKGLDKNLQKLVKDESKDWTADQMYKEAFKQTARETGALLGVSGVEGFQGAGQAFLKDLEVRGEDASGLLALGAGTVQSAIALLNPLNKVLAGRMPKGKSHIMQMTVGEAAEEMGQEVVAVAHEGGIRPDTTFGALVSSEEGVMRLFESGVAGALLGGTFGGGLRAIASKKDTTKKLVTEKPEEVLNKYNIDTSGDAVAPTDIVGPIAPDTQGFIGPQVDPATKDVPTLSQKFQEQPTYAESQRGSEEIATGQYEATLPPQAPGTQEGLEAGPLAPGFIGPQADPNAKDIPESEDIGVPQYQTPEGKRRIAAAQAMNAVATDWSTLETNDVTVGQTIDKLVLEDTPSPFKEEVTTANLKERQELKAAEDARVTEAKDFLQAEQARLSEVPEENLKDAPLIIKTAKTVAEVNKEEEVIAAQAVVREDDLKKKEEAKQKKILETTKEKKNYYGWQAKTNKVGKKTITNYSKGTSVVIKHNTGRFDLHKKEEGARVDFGSFLTLKDANAADAANQTSKEFYDKKTAKEIRKGEPLTNKAMRLIKSIDPHKIAAKAMAKRGESDSSGSEEAAVEGIIDAARTFTGKKEKFASYAYSAASFSIQDNLKKQGVEVQAPVIENAEGEFSKSAIDTATQEDIDLTTATPVQKTTNLTKKAKAAKRAKILEESPVTKVELTQTEKDAILKRTQEGIKQDEATKGRKSKITTLKDKAEKKKAKAERSIFIKKEEPDLEMMTIPQEVEVAETGEIVEIQEKASEALQRADDNIETLYNIKGCLT